MLLRIAVPSNKSDEPTHTQFKKNELDKKNTQRATHKKCLLFADLIDEHQLSGAILEESNEDHNGLFQRDLSLEHAAVGARCVILSPKIEGNQLKNGAWVITTNGPLEFVKEPGTPARPLKSERVGHEIRYCALHNKKVLLLEDDFIDPLRTKCNFHSCDRSHAKSLGAHTNCGCWMQNRRSDAGPRNTVLMFSFYFTDANEKVIKAADFSSLRTTKLFFQNQNVLADAEQLQTNTVCDCMQEQWRSVIEHINDNGGWTIAGWCIRAQVEDDEKEESDETLLRTNVKINVSCPHPTNSTMTSSINLPDGKTIKQEKALEFMSSNSP